MYFDINPDWCWLIGFTSWRTYFAGLSSLTCFRTSAIIGSFPSFRSLIVGTNMRENRSGDFWVELHYKPSARERIEVSLSIQEWTYWFWLTNSAESCGRVLLVARRYYHVFWLVVRCYIDLKRGWGACCLINSVRQRRITHLDQFTSMIIASLCTSEVYDLLAHVSAAHSLLCIRYFPCGPCDLGLPFPIFIMGL